jgi:energy-coupling factor transporter ATP-binding protein EcfA2/DNA modification methylase
MALLTLLDAQLTHVELPLLDRAAFSMEGGERIGLIGRNGSGKSSLLAVIAGRASLDEGEARLREGARVVLLEQEPALPASLPADHRTRAFLHRFGLSEELSPQAASGGEAKRAVLGLALALEPELLLLDEPTNHLDIESLGLLESALQDYSGTLLLVSHDLAFLDNVVTSVLAPEDGGKWKEYAGGYTDWPRQRPAAAVEEKPRGEGAGAREGAGEAFLQGAAGAGGAPRRDLGAGGRTEGARGEDERGGLLQAGGGGGEEGQDAGGGFRGGVDGEVGEERSWRGRRRASRDRVVSANQALIDAGHPACTVYIISRPNKNGDERVSSARLSAKQISRDSLEVLRAAAVDRTPVAGLTHTFYRYPARFSPRFVSAAIETFSKPGEVVLDPYVGGGTTVLEAMVRGRRPYGCDINSLAIFVARAKTSILSKSEEKSIRQWARVVVPRLSYHDVSDETAELICPIRTKNLNLPRARPAKKLLAQCILKLKAFQSEDARRFARCVLLNVAQWALNNRKTTPDLDAIRERIGASAHQMLEAMELLRVHLATHTETIFAPTLIHGSATDLPRQEPFSADLRADLIVTSPPYPGIHILYHRWQVNGRRETPAPYWIASCLDGKGNAYYNFADRRRDSDDDYFAESLRTLKAIRAVTRPGAIFVQMVAFSRPRSQLPRYLNNMLLAGFAEIREVQSNDKTRTFPRIWREVPGRAWHANLKGPTNSSREIVLIHRAV